MRLKTLAWTTAATAATAVAGGVATEPQGSWYLALRKPAWQPPAIAFPLVWTALYADLAVSSAVALDRAVQLDSATALHRAAGASNAGSPSAGSPADGGEGSRREFRAYRVALTANLVLNASWSWFFWRSRRPWLAAAEAALLAASSADLVRRTHRLNHAAGISLAAYAAWCGFATALSAAIARLNPGKR